MSDRIEQILAAVDSHEAVDPTYREGWHAAIAAIRVRLAEPDRCDECGGAEANQR